jgi:hypothetical protein
MVGGSAIAGSSHEKSQRARSAVSKHASARARLVHASTEFAIDRA